MSSFPKVLGTIALATIACGERPETAERFEEQAIPTTVPCDTVPARSGTIVAEGWGGTWRLTLVAATGPSAGHQVSGPMTLIESPASLRASVAAGFSAPWYGNAIVDVGAVGALDLGGVETSDSTAPGVLVMVASGGARAMLRFGTQANRVGQERFDGGYTVLTVAEGSADSLRGTWRSGVNDHQASGHFCARRPM